MRISLIAMLIAAASACHAQEASALDLSCTVEGKYAFASEDQICASFKSSIDQKLGASTMPVARFDSVRSGGIGVTISILPHGGLAAIVQYRDGGAVRTLPDIGIDILDRPLSMRDVDRLADLVSRQLADAIG